MSSVISIKNLPFNIENNKVAQLAFLSDLLGLDKELISNAGQNEVDAMCATILYRHLPQAQRNYAMQIIRSIQNGKLQGKLVDNVLYTTFVNPQWGIWSLTNKELEADKAVHSFIASYANYVGLSVSGFGLKELYDNIRKSKKMSKGGIVMLVIWGAVAFNDSELKKVNKEIENRKVQITTGFH